MMADKPRGVWLLVQAPDEAADRCYLFTDVFSRLLQVALAGWSVFLLYVKRQLEFPKRPLLVRAPRCLGIKWWWTRFDLLLFVTAARSGPST